MTQSKLFFNPLKNLADQFDKLVEGELWLKVIIALALGGGRVNGT
ncbi:MAG: hypothetical protein ACJA2G_003277 [Cognaticolwellia sp.]|jgi:hypothetical protein